MYPCKHCLCGHYEDAFVVQDGIFPASSFQTVDDAHYFFFSGSEERHEHSEVQSMRIGFATLPRDR